MNILIDSKKSWGSVCEIWSVYWSLYGRFYSILTSPYFHVSLLITCMCFKYWTNPGWWDTTISSIPTLLGFSLAGLSAFFAMSDEGFKRLLVYKNGEDASSPFLDVVVAFLHFIVCQVFAFIFALIAKSLFFKLENPPEFFTTVLPYMNIVGWGVGFLLLVYSCLLLLAAAFAIFRAARWYEKHITNRVNSESN